MKIEKKLIPFLIFLFNVIRTHKEKSSFKCRSKINRIKPKEAKEFPKNNKTSKRNLADEEFNYFNILLDHKHFESQMKLYNLNKYHDLYINSMNKVVETLQSLLKVFPRGCYTFEEDFLDEFGTYDWDRKRFGISSYKNYFNTCDYNMDLLIIPNFLNQTESLESDVESYVLWHRAYNHQPIVAEIKISMYLNLTKKNSDYLLKYFFLHSFIHLLGFNYDIIYEYNNYAFKMKDKDGVNRAYLNTPKVLQTAKKYFNCNNIKGVELEDFTFNPHWESRILLGEIMNAQYYLEEQVISEFTLSFLEDTGFYKANYYTGGLMRFGKNKGCSFLSEKCIKNHAINPNFENEFFDTIYSDSYIDPSCSSGRQSRTYFAVWIFKSYIPKYYRYYNNETYGGLAFADFCPVPRIHSHDEEKGYYAGSCSNLGSGDYGSEIYYPDDNYYRSGEIEAITGETYSSHSFCYLSSLTKKTEINFNIFSEVVRAICYETFCSSRSLTVKIHENYIVCPRQGGKIEVNGYGGFFLCPDYYLICSGTILCNDMFDCIEKKSKIKDNSYDYDYYIKTSQNIEKAIDEEADELDNYELSDDGKCTKNCKQCTEILKCNKCRNNFDLVHIKKNNSLVCISENELTIGYYKGSDSIYHECMKNCEICHNEIECDKCLNNFKFVNGKCINNNINNEVNNNIIDINKEEDTNNTNANPNNKDSKSGLKKGVIIGIIIAVILVIIAIIIIIIIYFVKKKIKSKKVKNNELTNDENKSENNCVIDISKMIEVVFEYSTGDSKKVIIDKEKTMSDLIKGYFNVIERPELFNRNDSICFLFGGKNIDFNSQQKVKDYFDNLKCPRIVVMDMKNLISSEDSFKNNSSTQMIEVIFNKMNGDSKIISIEKGKTMNELFILYLNSNNNINNKDNICFIYKNNIVDFNNEKKIENFFKNLDKSPIIIISEE